MSIFRCNKCGYIKEVPEKYIDKIAKCPKCGSENRVVDTVTFAQKVISAYTEKRNEIATHQKTVAMLQENISQANTTIEKAKQYINTQKEKYKIKVERLNATINDLQKQLS